MYIHACFMNYGSTEIKKQIIHKCTKKYVSTDEEYWLNNTIPFQNRKKTFTET